MTSAELRDIAKDLFRELVERTSGPQDGAEVVLYLHALIWKSQDEKVTSTKAMLDAFNNAFLEVIGEGPITH